MWYLGLDNLCGWALIQIWSSVLLLGIWFSPSTECYKFLWLPPMQPTVSVSSENCFSNDMAIGTEQYWSLEPFLGFWSVNAECRFLPFLSGFLKVTADTPVYNICIQNINVVDWVSETCTWLRLGHKLHKYELLVHSKTELVNVIKYLFLYLLSGTLPLHQVNLRCPKNALGRVKLV